MFKKSWSRQNVRGPHVRHLCFNGSFAKHFTIVILNAVQSDVALLRYYVNLRMKNPIVFCVNTL